MGGLTRFALENSRITLVFLVAIVILGVTIYLDYPRQEDPTIIIREAVVTAQFPGMSPERVEDLITRPVERAIRELPEVDEIRSDSKTGVSVVRVKIGDTYTDLQPIWQKLRDRMSDLAPGLPSGTTGPFVNDEVGLTAIATIAVWADGFTIGEIADVARDLRDALYALDGIKKVELYGIQDERFYLEVRNAKLAELGISPGVIVDTLQSQNIVLPGGTIDASGTNVVIEPSGNFNSVEELGAVTIVSPATGDSIPLIDIVTLERKPVDPPFRPVYYNGHKAVVVSVSIIEGINAVSFGDHMIDRVDAFEQNLPVGYVLEYATFQPDLVEAAVSDASSNVYQTLVIVLVVVMLFLGLRSGLIVGAIVPLAMLLAIVVMRILEIELQRVSIAAMIIALGLLVDNGIVVAEDIRRRVDEGSEKMKAALEAGSSLAVPLLTSSLTTILAFLPMMLAVGSAGEYTRSLSQVVIVVLLGSWFLAMTATPTLSAWLLPEPPKKPVRKPGAGAGADSGFYRFYAGLLRRILNLRLPFLAVVVVLFVGSLAVFQTIPKEFFPDSDRNQFLVYVDLPAGTSVRETDRVVREFTAWLANAEANPDVESAIGYVGDGGPRFVLSLSPIDPDPHLGFVTVNTTSFQVVEAQIEKTRDYLATAFPEARGRVKVMWLGSSEAGLVEIRISGPDAGNLFQQAAVVERALREIPGTLNVRSDWENKILKLRVEVDQAQAQRAGVTSEEIAQSLATFISGYEVTDFREGDLIIPIVLRGTDAERDDLAALQSINVYSASKNVHVPLPQVARLIPEWQVGRIKHLDQQRTVTIEAVHRSMTAGELVAAMLPTLESLELGPGAAWSIGGELKNSSEAQSNLFVTMPYCIAAIVILLIWQFNSFRRPLIILLTVPLSFIGAVVGLIVMQAPFGFMVILGLFSLAGIIINNGIVLIDRIEQEREAGLSVGEAIVRAAVLRFRPIVMTTTTTVLGLIPLILFGGPLWYGLSNVIAFGLAVGTVLTLGVVPVLYSLFFEGFGRPAPEAAKDRMVASASA